MGVLGAQWRCLDPSEGVLGASRGRTLLDWGEKPPHLARVFACSNIVTVVVSWGNRGASWKLVGASWGDRLDAACCCWLLAEDEAQDGQSEGQDGEDEGQDGENEGQDGQDKPEDGRDEAPEGLRKLSWGHFLAEDIFGALGLLWKACLQASGRPAEGTWQGPKVAYVCHFRASREEPGKWTQEQRMHGHASLKRKIELSLEFRVQEGRIQPEKKASPARVWGSLFQKHASRRGAVAIFEKALKKR